MKNGNLSINSENIFPVIKKWLYSDHDIFLVSNPGNNVKTENGIRMEIKKEIS